MNNFLLIRFFALVLGLLFGLPDAAVAQTVLPDQSEASRPTQANTSLQSDNLKRLLREREELIKEYAFYNAQNSNFWGKKSKKDLLHIVDALKGIINKDTEIINEINTLNMQKQSQISSEKIKIETEKKRIESQVVDDKRVVNENFYELKSQLQNLQNLQKVKQRQINDLEESLLDAQDRNQDLQQLLAVSAVVLLGMLFFILYLRRPRPRKKR
jgi:CRISPR/Cas system-associated endoribonuclease Cas2